MKEDEKFQMMEAMRKYGGGFMQCLAECFQHADADNLQRLLKAFPEYVERYTAMGKMTPIPGTDHFEEAW